MSTERTYGDDEIQEIFAAASRPEAAGSGSDLPVRGLTLAELQAIGREAGLDPVAVARAAAALDSGGMALQPRRSLGMPVEVSRVVPLSRAPTSEEWEQLVAELRATFRARGRVYAQGGMKEWVNGNLHACVEPDGPGYRLRLGTVKSGARELNAVGVVSVIGGAATLGAFVLSGGAMEIASVPWMLALSGAGAFAANFLRLPRWAGERQRQMEYIAGRIGAIMDAAPRTGGA